MKTIIQLLVVTSALLPTIATTASASATLVKNESGKVIGATDVTIGSQSYSVAFGDGTCTTVYGACSSPSYDFNNSVDALAAGRALIDQVFTGDLYSRPSNTFGCGDRNGATGCATLILYGDYSSTQFLGVLVSNDGGKSPSTAYTTQLGKNINTSNNDSYNFARFALTSSLPPGVIPAVPEPSTWAMMLIGFAIVGAASRYRSRGAKVAYA